MARGFYWSNNINMPSPSGGVWPSVGEYGSIGWTSAGTVQTGSGAAFVDVVGAGILNPASLFESNAANALEYTGGGGTFFVTAQINLDNPEIEEASVQLRLALNGIAIADTTMTVIHSANSIDELTSSAQVVLASGDILTAQVTGLSGATDLTSTYFRMQALRVG